MRLYSVPPPLNLIALPYDLLWYIAHAAYTRACCCKQKSVAPHPRHTQPSAGSASPQEGSDLKRKGADSEPTSRLQSALERRGTRVRLMSTDDSVQKGAFALFSQDEAERAEDTARHSWLHWLENNNIASTEMGKKEDQILAAVKRIFRDSVEMRGKVELVFAQIEELKLKSLEDGQKTRDDFLKLHRSILRSCLFICETCALRMRLLILNKRPVGSVVSLWTPQMSGFRESGSGIFQDGPRPKPFLAHRLHCFANARRHFWLALVASARWQAHGLDRCSNGELIGALRRADGGGHFHREQFSG